jgi:ATP-grasp domain
MSRLEFRGEAVDPTDPSDLSTNVDALPRLAVFHDEYSPSMFDLVEASRGLCRLVWIVGYSSHQSPIRILSRFGDVVDLTRLTAGERMSFLATLQPDGVIVFSDRPLRMAAEMAAHLSLPFHSPPSSCLLTDKLAQRTALKRAGIPVPAFASIRSGQIEGRFPFPAVLKPRAGAGSRDTFKVESLQQVADALAGCDPDEEFILEEWLPDRSTQTGLAADMVSVESVVRGGVVDHIAVTGRFPLAPPFRETGLFLPSDFGPVDREMAIAVAGEAIDALQPSHGFLHTEVKMTPDGPRIIEVNGRLGGGISGLISRLGGPSLLRWAIRIALGMPIGPVPVIPASPVAFYLYFLAPLGVTKVESMNGVPELHALAGVDEVHVNRRTGDTVSSQMSGHLDHLIRLDGMVGSHAELDTLIRELIPSVLELRFSR